MTASFFPDVLSIKHNNFQANGAIASKELDTPGHEIAIGMSHREHIACFEASPWSEFASGKWDAPPITVE